MIRIFGVISLLFVLLTFAIAESANTMTINDNTLQQSVGQMIVVGFAGNNDTSPDFRRIIEDLEAGVIGGVFFLFNNIQSRSQIETMVREVRQCKCSVRPLVAIDEEGGPSERLGPKSGFQHIASAAELGRGNEENARIAFERIAQKLADIGFNMNFAPVVDLNKNPMNPIIGYQDRSFSSNPAAVSRYAKIFIEEHHKKGILTTLKHFPGHGSSSTDSHKTIANIESTWSSEELIPYEDLINAGYVDTIMVGHLINTPRWGGIATQYGSSAISRMLRVELKYDGVILSDDLSMNAVRTTTTLSPDVIKSAVKAGIDIVIVSGLNGDKSVSTGRYINSVLYEGLASGEIEVGTIRKSVQRITSLKGSAARKLSIP